MRDLAGRIEVASITADRTEPLTAATVAGSINLRDAVIAEGRNRRLALMLMLMSLAAGADETETTALEPA